MIASIAGLGTVDGRGEEVERPWRMGIRVYRAIAGWVEWMKRQRLGLYPTPESPLEGIVAHRNLCQEGDDP